MCCLPFSQQMGLVLTESLTFRKQPLSLVDLVRRLPFSVYTLLTATKLGSKLLNLFCMCRSVWMVNHLFIIHVCLHEDNGPS